MDRTPTVVKMDPPAPTQPVALAAGERPVPSARRLAAASVSPNTRRAYSGALRRLDAWLAGRALEDATLAVYLAELHEQGRAPSSASTAVAAARFRARLVGEPSPAGERTARVLRSEVSALRWADVAESAAGDGMLVTVRRGKTNPAGETKDVRFVKGNVARALQTLRSASSPSPGDPVVPLSPQMVGLRFQAAARSAGIEPVTAHSGRVGLASELTRRGASTTDVMLAGNWKTSRMVAHYSSGATAERGAVAQYL